MVFCFLPGGPAFFFFLFFSLVADQVSGHKFVNLCIFTSIYHIEEKHGHFDYLEMCFHIGDILSFIFFVCMCGVLTRMNGNVLC